MTSLNEPTAVPRTHDDEWGITDSVGVTALAIAAARAREATVEQPLFDDPHARYFVDAAIEQGWRPSYDEKMIQALVAAEPRLVERLGAMSGYLACRTRFFDDYFVAASADGIEQVVVLAAGLDSRAWRLPWAAGTTVYEIDQPQVLEFKAATLEAHSAEPIVRYVSVPIDLRQDWPAALHDAGFDPARPTAWSAEGLLAYLPADGQDRLLEQILQQSAHGSRIAVEAFGNRFFDPDATARRNEEMSELRAAAAERAGVDAQLPSSFEHLWYMEEHADVTLWLQDRGWRVNAIDAPGLLARYGRPAPVGFEEYVIDTTLVEASLP
jgi:methyltransferase (TIGR00027 family)